MGWGGRVSSRRGFSWLGKGKGRGGVPQGCCLISELACLCVPAKQRSHSCSCFRRVCGVSEKAKILSGSLAGPVGPGVSEEASLLISPQDVDQQDPRGRSLLHLAVSLGYVESARVLLRHKADVTKENAQGWTGEPSERVGTEESAEVGRARLLPLSQELRLGRLKAGLRMARTNLLLIARLQCRRCPLLQS